MTTNIVNKCFLYIDNYPKWVDDVPFNLTVNWGDGTALESYTNRSTMPFLTHTYYDNNNHTIAVAICKLSCSSNNIITVERIYNPYPVSPTPHRTNTIIGTVPSPLSIASFFLAPVVNATSTKIQLVTCVSTTTELKPFDWDQEYFSPITIRTGLVLTGNELVSVKYYRDAPRHYCEVINELLLSPGDLENLKKVDQFAIDLSVPTVATPIIVTYNGTFNHTWIT